MPRTLLCLVVLCAALPTLADTTPSSTMSTPMPMLDRADRALAHALPVVFENGSMRSRDLPALGTARHQVTLGELNFQAFPRFDIHCGAGLAHIIDAPPDSRLPTTGFAAIAGASFAIYEPAGFRLGVEFSALHVGYGAAGLNDGTVLFAFTAH